MFYQVAILCCVAATVLAAPTDVVPLEKQQPTVIPIISQSDELEPNGTYKYSYETGNGIKREEISYDKVVPKLEGRSGSSNEGGESDDSDEIHVQRGSYSYTAPDGTLITLRYIADENGFQAFGDHLPRAPQVSTSSAEKSGRALKGADSAEAASAPALAAKPESTPEATKPVPEKAATSEVQPESAPTPAVSSGEAKPSENPATPEQPAPTEAIEQSSTTISAEPLSINSEQAAASTASDQSATVASEQSTTTIASEQSTTVAAEESSTASADQPASTSAAEQPVSTTIAEQSATTVNAESNSAETAEQPVPPSEQPLSTEAPAQSPEDAASTTVSV